jgi:hypothetical protein
MTQAGPSSRFVRSWVGTCCDLTEDGYSRRVLHIRFATSRRRGPSESIRALPPSAADQPFFRRRPRLPKGPRTGPARCGEGHGPGFPAPGGRVRFLKRSDVLAVSDDWHSPGSAGCCALHPRRVTPPSAAEGPSRGTGASRAPNLLGRTESHPAALCPIRTYHRGTGWGQATTSSMNWGGPEGSRTFRGFEYRGR